jgi:glycosyltransferase involved in cell wall biosynthesis
LIVVNVGWFFVSHRLPVALAAKEAGYEVHVATALDEKLDRKTPDLLEKHGIALHEMRFSRSGAGASEFVRDIADLWRLFRRVRPDVVHLVALKPLLLGGAVARVLGLPGVVMAVPGRGSVFSATGFVAACKRRLALMAYKWAYSPGRTRVIVQNIEDRGYFVSRGIFRQGEMRLIRGSGANVHAFTPAAEARGKSTIVLASRMLKEKGVEDFVSAAARLKQRGHDVRCVLVGAPDHGNPHSHSQEELEAWAASGAVEWWGHRSDMSAVFAEASIVCLPTYYGEGVPKVLIEAAACGRPIVTTDTAGCRDVVRNGINGLLVAPRDVDGLCTALETLLRDASLRQSMGLRGREIAESEFDVERVVQQTLDVYRELLK